MTRPVGSNIRSRFVSYLRFVRIGMERTPAAALIDTLSIRTPCKSLKTKDGRPPKSIHFCPGKRPCATNYQLRSACQTAEWPIVFRAS